MSERVFKDGLKTGIAATDARVRTELRKQDQRRQDRLAMRRGRNHSNTIFVEEQQQQEKKRTDIVVFRELRDRVKDVLTHWFNMPWGLDFFATQESTQLTLNAMEGLSEFLFFYNRDLALSAYPEMFGGNHGKELVRRIAFFVDMGYRQHTRIFQIAVGCVTKIMYEPENIACVEVLCSYNIHGIALRLLSNVHPDTSQIRQELFEMLGNTARNNQYARDIVLSTEGLVETMHANLSDAVQRSDWGLISATFYMMYVLCETCTGGETPPLSFFNMLMPLFVGILNNVSAIAPERTPDINEAYVGAMAFLEAICLSDGRLDDNMTPLMVERRRGIITLAQHQDVRGALFQAASCNMKSVQKKAIAALSFMCSAGVDAIHPLVSAGMIPILMHSLRRVSIEPYTKRHILRIIFLITKYDDAYMQLLIDAEVIDYLCQAIQGHMGTLDTQQLNYAVWALCRATLCKGDPFYIKKYLVMVCDQYTAVRGFTETLHRCVSGGNTETSNDILKALRRLFEFVPRQSKIQFEEADGLAALSQIMHQAHVQSELYKQATFLHDTYFGDY